MSRSWMNPIRRLFYPWHLPIRRSAATGKRRRPALRLEQLEYRLTPAPMTFTVTDNSDASANSLRAAITASNANNPGSGMFNTIDFAITGSGVQTIRVLSSLPTITQPVKIDGYSENNGTTQATPNTLANADNAVILIQLDGTSAGTNVNGLTLGTGSAGSTIDGLDITNFQGDGSLNNGIGILVQSNSNTIVGNFVGVNPAGTTEMSNQGDGIRIVDASNNIIGTTNPADRNISSGNYLDGIHVEGTLTTPVTGNAIEGNFVGVAADGKSSVGKRSVPIPNAGALGTAAGNFLFGIEISGGNSNTVGGATAGAGNAVGFNSDGIEVDNGGQMNVIQGNFVGVGADGVTPTANLLHGIALRSSNGFSAPLGPAQPNEPGVSNNLIGGTAAGDGNTVEFNGTGGIAVFGNPVSASNQPNVGNAIEGNSVFENGRSFLTAASAPTPLLGIDLTNAFKFPRDDGLTPNDSKGHGAANDPNNFQNFPVITSVFESAGNTNITGVLAQSVSPNTTFRIEFFANNPDPLGLPAEGQQFLGFTTVTTDANANASFSVSLPVSVANGRLITVTATDPTGNTSEFSAGVSPGTIVVTDTSDASANSLRAAITASNANNPGAGMVNTIDFAITGTGVQKISLLSALPTISQAVVINGYSENNGTTQATPNTLANADNAVILIQLDGTSAGTNVNGLTLGSGSAGSTIKGLDITNFQGAGIVVQSDGNTIVGNFVGVNPAGTTEMPNQGDGIRIVDASNNNIGSTNPADRNIASGNLLDGIHVEGTLTTPATGNLIQGNFVGLAADGTSGVSVAAGSQPTGITQGADGNLWFTESANNAIGRITPAGTVTTFSLAGLQADSGPIDIVSDPTNNLLYFTEKNVGQIGSLNPMAGSDAAILASMTESAVVPSGAGAGVNGITVGPGGNLWFTEASANRVGKVSTNLATINEFSTGITTGAAPTNIVTGSDGALWFTEFGNNAIGRITTTGTVTEFSLADFGTNNGPFDIASDTTNDLLYFTQKNTGTIGSINPLAGSDALILASETQSAVVPSGASAEVSGITLGPDGNLWFTEQGVDRIGNITPNLATINEFTGLASGAAPADIVTGPDGALWFTEFGNNAVGRITKVGSVTNEFSLPTVFSGNNLFGIEISGGNNNTVGGSAAGARNVVAFNGAGIEVDNGGQNNIIQGNFVGVGADGVTAAGNLSQGIVLRSSNGFSAPLGPAQPNEPGVSNNLIGGTAAGDGNLVENNGAGGIVVFGNPVSASNQPNIGNAIEGNSLFENGRNNPTFLPGIDLTNSFLYPKEDGVTPNDSKGHGAPNDPNSFQNFPVLTSALLNSGQTTVTGTLHSTPSSTFRIEFFASDADPAGGLAEGEQFFGFLTVTSDATGDATFKVTFNDLEAVGRLVTATATDGNGNTSEFSTAVSVQAAAAPSITSADTTTFTVGTADSFTVTTTGVPTPALTESGTLPSGVTFTDNGNGSASLGGTPAAGSGGTYPLTITAANGESPNATQNFTLTVNEVPTILTNPMSQTVHAGQSVTFTAAANGFPTPSVQWEVSTNDGAGYSPVSGATSDTLTLTTAGGQNGNLYEAVFSNSVGSATTTAAALTVQTAPAFTSGTPTSSVTAGQVYSFTFTTSGNPSPTLTADHLPSWLTFNPATGVLSGSSTLAMTYDNLEVVAANAVGSATQTFNLTVNPAAASRFMVSAPASATAGTAFKFTVTAEDQFDNTATSYTGTVHFASTDGAVVLPANSTLTNGAGTFSATLKTAGSQTITATDTTDSSITGTSNAIAVSAVFHPSEVATFDNGVWELDINGTTQTDDYGIAGDIPIVGDWNGAGYDEIGVVRTLTNITLADGHHPLEFVLNVTGTGIYTSSDEVFIFGESGDHIVLGDWNGDGRTKVGVVRPGANGDLLWSLDYNGNFVTTGQYTVYQNGLGTDSPVVGDWNGQGKDEIGVVRPSNGTLEWVLDTNGDGTYDSGDSVFFFGLPGDHLIVGDWTGSGTTKIGTYRGESNGLLAFSLDKQGNGVYQASDAAFYGLATDEGLVGDWTDTGVGRIGVDRPAPDDASLVFALDDNGNGVYDSGDAAFAFGQVGGQVLVGRWQP